MLHAPCSIRFSVPVTASSRPTRFLPRDQALSHLRPCFLLEDCHVSLLYPNYGHFSSEKVATYPDLTVSCPDSVGSLDTPPPPRAVTADLVVSGFGPSEMLEQRGQVLELSHGPDKSKAGNAGQIGQLPLDTPIAWADVGPMRTASMEDSMEYSVESDHDHHRDDAAVSDF